MFVLRILVLPKIDQPCLDRHNLAAAIDPDNSGVLIVQFEGGTGVDRARARGAPVLGPDDISRRIEQRDNGCIIM